jgi:hypothetical protein
LIAPLRHRHRLIFVILAILLPIGLVMGIRARQPIPHAAASAERESGFQPVELLLSEGPAIELSVRSDRGLRQIRLKPSVSLKRPDILVYAAPAEHNDLSEMFLMGALAGTGAHTYSIPEQIDADEIGIVLYALAHQEVVARMTFRWGR